jgi:hypothetical protein
MGCAGWDQCGIVQRSEEEQCEDKCNMRSGQEGADWGKWV